MSRVESKVILRQWSSGPSVEPLTMIDSSSKRVGRMVER